jgi:hypothetical protein
MTLVFYYNANLDLTDYRLYDITRQHAPSWWLRNASGAVFTAPIDSGAGARPPFPYNAASGGVPVYDFTVAAMRDAWVQECFNVTSPSIGFDGCMVDRWTRDPFGGGEGFTKEAMAAWIAGTCTSVAHSSILSSQSCLSVSQSIKPVSRSSQEVALSLTAVFPRVAPYLIWLARYQRPHVCCYWVFTRHPTLIWREVLGAALCSMLCTPT